VCSAPIARIARAPTGRPDVFDSFERAARTVEGNAIHYVRGGSGAPLLLLHGYPQTHVIWHRVAPRLAERFTVVAPDLRGYGDSGKPPSAPDHSPYSKRVMAAEQVALMAALGFDRFAVAGHDRGGRVAYRMAIDHPERVTKLATLDMVPTSATFDAVDKAMAMATWHWFFLAQPYDLPERLIGGDPGYYLRAMLSRWSGTGLSVFDPDALKEYVRCFSDPAAIHASCEDYRAGATIDAALDAADRGTHAIRCPMLALWGEARKHRHRYGVLDTWSHWATDVRGHGLPCGHFLPEEAPAETAKALETFL
jgi:haloacetate dehalogenase